jgi:hypothetical protein
MGEYGTNTPPEVAALRDRLVAGMLDDLREVFLSPIDPDVEQRHLRAMRPGMHRRQAAFVSAVAINEQARPFPARPIIRAGSSAHIDAPGADANQ